MAKKQKIISPKRGEVFLVSFDPTVGREIRKTKPALILQNNVANRYSPITIVAAITSRYEEPIFPTEVLVRAPEGGLVTDSVILLNHIRSIDKRRLIKRLGRIDNDTIGKVERALEISLGLVRM